MSRPRIVMFAPHFAEYALRLSEAMAASATVLLILDKDNLEAECRPQWVSRAKTAGVRILAYRYRNTLWRAAWFALIMLRVRLFGPAIVHMQEQADGSSLRIAEHLSRRWPLALTVHDPRPHSGKDAELLAAFAHRAKRLRSLASIFHVHGAFCAKELSPEAAGRPIVSTQHAELLVPEPDEAAEPLPGRVLMFGRMEAYKGVEAALDAAEIVAARGVKIELQLAGRGPELERLAARIAASPIVSVESRFLTPAEVIRAFQQACLVILPYKDATQSGVVSAAIGAGRPTVAFAVGGLVDSVVDGVTGRLAAAGDVTALADRVAELLADPAAAAELGRNAAAAGRGEFAWRTVADRLLEAYRAAVAGPAARPAATMPLARAAP